MISCLLPPLLIFATIWLSLFLPLSFFFYLFLFANFVWLSCFLILLVFITNWLYLSVFLFLILYFYLFFLFFSSHIFLFLLAPEQRTFSCCLPFSFYCFFFSLYISLSLLFCLFISYDSHLPLLFDFLYCLQMMQDNMKLIYE